MIKKKKGRANKFRNRTAYAAPKTVIDNFKKPPTDKTET